MYGSNPPYVLYCLYIYNDNNDNLQVYDIKYMYIIYIYTYMFMAGGERRRGVGIREGACKV